MISSATCVIRSPKATPRSGGSFDDFSVNGEWTVRDSNPRPRRCERRALPAELTAQTTIVDYNICVSPVSMRTPRVYTDMLINESLLATLGFGFVLGLKHATEADHLAAVSTIVSERRSIWHSAVVGAL